MKERLRIAASVRSYSTYSTFWLTACYDVQATDVQLTIRSSTDCVIAWHNARSGVQIIDPSAIHRYLFFHITEYKPSQEAQREATDVSKLIVGLHETCHSELCSCSRPILLSPFLFIVSSLRMGSFFQETTLTFYYSWYVLFFNNKRIKHVVENISQKRFLPRALQLILSISIMSWYVIFNLLLIPFNLFLSLSIDITFFVIVPTFHSAVYLLTLLLRVERSTHDIRTAYWGWRDNEPSNSLPLDLFRFRGQVLFISDRCLIFKPDVEGNYTQYKEVLRLLRNIRALDNSFMVTGSSIVMIYNKSPYAKAKKDSSTIHLSIPYRSDIRERSFLNYSVKICGETAVHNGLINTDTYKKMVPAIRDCYKVLENGYHFSIMNLVKSVLVTLVPAVLVSTSYRMTKWDFLKWIGDSEIEIFFGVLGSISLFRAIRQDAPIWYKKLPDVPERIEQVARIVTDKPNDASNSSTAWCRAKSFRTIDCKIKNGMEAFMLAHDLVYEKHGHLKIVGLDHFLTLVDEGKRVEKETNTDDSKREVIFVTHGYRESQQDVDNAVQEFNEQFDGIIPEDVWIGKRITKKAHAAYVEEEKMQWKNMPTSTLDCWAV